MKPLRKRHLEDPDGDGVVELRWFREIGSGREVDGTGSGTCVRCRTFGFRREGLEAFAMILDKRKREISASRSVNHRGRGVVPHGNKRRWVNNETMRTCYVRIPIMHGGTTKCVAFRLSWRANKLHSCLSAPLETLKVARCRLTWRWRRETSTKWPVLSVHHNPACTWRSTRHLTKFSKKTYKRKSVQRSHKALQLHLETFFHGLSVHRPTEKRI